MNTNPNPQPIESIPTIAALPAPDPLEQLNRTLAKLEAAEKRLAEMTSEREAFECNPVIFALRNLDAGSVMNEAGDKLSQLRADVLRRQGKGQMTIKIDVAPYRGEALEMEMTIAVRAPREERQRSIFFVGSDGNLSRNDPRQRELGLK